MSEDFSSSVRVLESRPTGFFVLNPQVFSSFESPPSSPPRGCMMRVVIVRLVSCFEIFFFPFFPSLGPPCTSYRKRVISDSPLEYPISSPSFPYMTRRLPPLPPMYFSCGPTPSASPPRSTSPYVRRGFVLRTGPRSPPRHLQGGCPFSPLTRPPALDLEIHGISPLSEGINPLNFYPLQTPLRRRSNFLPAPASFRLHRCCHRNLSICLVFIFRHFMEPTFPSALFFLFLHLPTPPPEIPGPPLHKVV